MGIRTLKANLSTMWLTPRNSSSSNREPASMYTPMPANGPGRDSVATRTPLGNIVIWSSSVGSLFVSAFAVTGSWESRYLLYWIDLGSEPSTQRRWFFGCIRCTRYFTGDACKRTRLWYHSLKSWLQTLVNLKTLCKIVWARKESLAPRICGPY